MVTVLIPTHNRSSYLARCLAFLSSCNMECKIVIADSSDEDCFNRNISSITSNDKNGQLRLLDFRGMGIVEKYCRALSEIDTPFVTICGDDDFIIPAAVQKCASFLAENTDYSHAHGKIITFWERQSMSHPIMRVGEYPQFGNEGELDERLISHFENYNNNFYSVHRTSNLAKNFHLVFDLKIGRGLKERALSALDVCDGKRKMFDDLFILRQKGMTGTDEAGRSTFGEDRNAPDYFSRQLAYGFDLYRSFLASVVKNDLTISGDEFVNIFSAVDRDYLKWKSARTRKVGRNGLRRFVSEDVKNVYRGLRDWLNIQNTKFRLTGSERELLGLASAAISDFYRLK